MMANFNLELLDGHLDAPASGRPVQLVKMKFQAVQLAGSSFRQYSWWGQILTGTAGENQILVGEINLQPVYQYRSIYSILAGCLDNADGENQNLKSVTRGRAEELVRTNDNFSRTTGKKIRTLEEYSGVLSIEKCKTSRNSRFVKETKANLF